MDVQEQCCQEVARVIRLLKLVPDDQVVVRRRPWHGDRIHPGISVCPLPEREAPGSNIREDIGYGVLVADIAGVDTSLTNKVGTMAERRAIMRRRLIHSRLNITHDGSHYCQTKIEPGDLNELPRGIDSHEVSSFVVRCWVRESRTS